MKKLSINLVAAIVTAVAIIGALLTIPDPDIFYSGFFAGAASTVAAVMWLDD